MLLVPSVCLLVGVAYCDLMVEAIKMPFGMVGDGLAKGGNVRLGCCSFDQKWQFFGVEIGRRIVGLTNGDFVA